MFNNADNVWSMAATSAFSVIGMDDTVLEGTNGGLNVSGLIEGIRVNKTLHVKLVTDRQARINGGGSASPVLVQLETTSACNDLFAERFWSTVVALASDTYVEWELVTGYQHVPSIVCSWSASRCTCTSASDC